jgi:hypothetical protein
MEAGLASVKRGAVVINGDRISKPNLSKRFLVRLLSIQPMNRYSKFNNLTWLES